GDSISLEFEIEAPTPFSQATVGVSLINSSGDPIVAMSSKVQNIPRISISSRFWRVNCDMGPIPLNAGNYFARIYVGDGKRDYCRFSNVFNIRVVEKDVFGWGASLPPVESWGALYWVPRWQIEPK